MQVTLQNYINKNNYQVNSIKSNRGSVGCCYKAFSNDTVSFTGKKDFLDRPVKEIYEIITDVIKNKNNKLGYGGEADVYDIPSTDYCVRLLRLTDSDDITCTYPDYKGVFTKDVSNKDKVNHVVARLGNDTTIMRKLKGTPIISPNMNFSESRYILNQVMNFPVSSYNKFLKQLSNGYYNNMLYDPHPSNVIVDLDKKTLTAIDFQPDERGFSGFSPLTHMYFTFAHFCTEFIQQSSISNKIMHAALEELKPNVNPCLSLDKFDFTNFIESLMCQPHLDLDISIPELVSLDSDLSRLIYLKTNELRGLNVADDLKNSHKRISDKIDNIFYIANGF